MTDTPTPDPAEALARLTEFCDEFERVNAVAKPATADDFYALNMIACRVSDIRALLHRNVGAVSVEDVAKLLAEWGVRSKHGEWSDLETQLNAAREILALFPSPSPSVVTTVEELEALPVGSVIQDSAGQVYQYGDPSDPDDREWHGTHSGTLSDWERALALPATVLPVVANQVWDEGYRAGLNDSSLAETDDGWHENPYPATVLTPTTPPPSEVRVTAEDLAGALALALHDAHPAYGNTAGHRGGIGGSTITHGCSFIDPPPGSEWTQYDLLSMPLRKWMEDNPTFDLNVAKDRVKRAALESIGIPVAGEAVDRG